MSQANELAESLNSKYVLLRLDESNQNVPLEAIGIYQTEEEAYAEALMNQMQAIEDSTKNKPKTLLHLKHDAILELCRYLKDDLTNYKARFEYLSSQCTELFHFDGANYKVLCSNILHGQEMNGSVFKTRVRNFQDIFQSLLVDEEEDLEESNDEDDDEEEVDDDDDDDEAEEEEGEEGVGEEEEDDDDDEEAIEEEEDIDEVEELEEEEDIEVDQEEEVEASEDAVHEGNDGGSEGESEYGEQGQKRSRFQSHSDDDEEEDEIEEDGDEDELEEEEESSNKKQRLTA